MIWRKHVWFGSLSAAAAALLLGLSADESGGQTRSATIVYTASNNGETSPCG